MTIPSIFRQRREILETGATVGPEAEATAPAVETPLGGAGGSRRLGFNMQHQQQTKWCWAAVSTSTSRFYQPTSPWYQCLLVNRVFGQTTCCQNGASAPCNQPHRLEQGFAAVGHDAGNTSGTVSFARVRSEIDAGRPVGCFIGWRSGGLGHFVIIEGYREDGVTRRLWIEDSQSGSHDYEFTTFRDRYDNARGSWQWTYFTR